MAAKTGIGLSIIEAINEILESVGEFPIGGGSGGNVPPSDASIGDEISIARRAEDFLKRETRRIQALGWPETTTRIKAYTASTSGGSTIALGATVLAVKGCGPDAHRNFGIINQNLYDGNAGTTTILPTDQDGDASAKVYLTITEQVSASWPQNFEMNSPRLKDLIVSHTKMIFQRRILGSTAADPGLQQEYMLAELNASRNVPDADYQAANTQPTILQLQMPGEGAQQ
jgi:hypothetical protein